MVAELFIVEPKIKAKRFILGQKEFKIGREADNDLVIDEKKVSKYHAKIFRDQGSWMIQDMNSTNGTQVNQRKIAKVMLENHSTIVIGSHTLSFSEEEAATMMMASPFVENRVSEGDSTLIEGKPPDFSFDDRATVPTYMPELIQAKERPRFYAIGEHEAGRDFLLDRDEAFIGSDSECDIVLNHAFISRRHAKILHLGEDYVIIDQNSTNGLFVNGKKARERKMVPGDVIALGPLQLRFSDRGEIFSPLLESKKRAGIKVPVLRIFLVLMIISFAAGGYYLYSQEQARKSAIQKKIQQQSKKDLTLFSAGNEFYDQKKWEEAAGQYRDISKKFKQYAEVQTKLEKADKEVAYRKEFYRLQDALDKKDFARAITQASSIPADSPYQTEAMKKLAEVKSQYLTELEQQSREQIAQGRFDESITACENALKLDPRNETFTALLQKANAGRDSHSQAMAKATDEEKKRDQYRQLLVQAQKNFTDSAALYLLGKPDDAIKKLDAVAKLSLTSKEKVLADAKARMSMIQQLAAYHTEGLKLFQEGKQPEGISKWEEMLKLEKPLVAKSPSAFAREVAPKMSDYYSKNADAKFKEGKMPLAYQLWSKAIQISPDNSTAKAGLDQLNTKAQDLYREGYSAAGYNNIERAKKLFREVLTIVPPENEYYKKAQEKLIQFE